MARKGPGMDAEVVRQVAWLRSNAKDSCWQLGSGSQSKTYFIMETTGYLLTRLADCCPKPKGPIWQTTVRKHNLKKKKNSS